MYIKWFWLDHLQPGWVVTSYLIILIFNFCICKMKTVVLRPSQRLWSITESMWAICLHSAQNTVKTYLILKTNLIFKILEYMYNFVQRAGIIISYYTERYRKGKWLIQGHPASHWQVNTRSILKKKHVQRWLTSVTQSFSFNSE